MNGWRPRPEKIPWVRLIGILLLVILLWQLDMATVAQIMRQTNPALLAAAIALNLPMVLLKSLRWQALMFPQEIRYSVGKAYTAHFGSIFIGFLTPGRLGEFVKAVHINQDCGVPMGKAVSGVLADRLFDLSALLLVGGTALLTLSGGRTELAALIGAALWLLPALLFFLNDRLFTFIRQVGLKLGSPGRKLFAADSWLLDIRRGLRQLSWPWVVTAILLTALAYALFFSQCYLLALSLNLPIGFAVSSYAVALGSLITLLPLSISGLGTRDVAIIAYLGAAGVPPAAALGFSLLVFFTFYLSGGLMGALFWWLKPVPLPKKTSVTGNG